MRLMFLILLILSCSVFSRSLNRSALGEDTCIIADFYEDSLKYTKWFSMGDEEDIVVTVMVDDTSSAGLSGDSIALYWGYQVSGPVYDTSYTPANEVNVPQVRISKDTMLSDSLGKLPLNIGSESVGTGVTLTYPGKLIDTLSNPGLACQRRTIYPEYDTFFRIFLQGLTGNVTGAPLVVTVKIERKSFINVRRK